MAIKLLDKIEVGMIIKKDIYDHRNRLLLNKGTEINERHIRIFKTWGITSVDIVDTDMDEKDFSAPVNIDPKLLKETKQKANNMFKFNDLNQPVVQLLYDLSVQRMTTLLMVKNK